MKFKNHRNAIDLELKALENSDKMLEELMGTDIQQIYKSFHEE
jgi:hypothetical protein